MLKRYEWYDSIKVKNAQILFEKLTPNNKYLLNEQTIETLIKLGQALKKGEAITSFVAKATEEITIILKDAAKVEELIKDSAKIKELEDVLPSLASFIKTNKADKELLANLGKRFESINTIRNPGKRASELTSLLENPGAKLAPALSRQVAGLAMTLTEEQRKYLEAGKKISSLEGQVKTAQTDLQRLETELEQSIASAKQAEATTTKETARVSELEKNLKQLEDHNRALTSANIQLQANIRNNPEFLSALQSIVRDPNLVNTKEGEKAIALAREIYQEHVKQVESLIPWYSLYPQKIAEGIGATWWNAQKYKYIKQIGISLGATTLFNMIMSAATDLIDDQAKKDKVDKVTKNISFVVGLIAGGSILGAITGELTSVTRSVFKELFGSAPAAPAPAAPAPAAPATGSKDPTKAAEGATGMIGFDTEGNPVKDLSKAAKGSRYKVKFKNGKWVYTTAEEQSPAADEVPFINVD